MLPVMKPSDFALTPGQMNPYNQAVSSGLQNYQDIVKTAYAKPTAQSQILSKAAYAAYAPASYAAKVLGDPTAVALMMQTPEGQAQLKNLMHTVGSMPASPYGALDGDQSQGSSFFSGLKNVAQNIFKSTGMTGDDSSSGNPTQEQPQTSGQPQSQNQNVPQQNQPMDASTNELAGGPGSSVNPNTAPDNAPMNNSAAPAPQAPQQAAPTQPAAQPGNYDSFRKAATAKVWPLSPEATELKVGQEQQIAQATGDIKLSNDLWEDRFKSNGNKAENAEKTLVTLNAMKDKYEKLNPLQTGSGFGKLPALGSSNAQTLDQLAEIQSTNNAKALAGGRVTNNEFDIASRIKPGRWMNKEAFNDMVDYNIALTKRDLQKQRFDAEVKKRKIPMQDGDAMWGMFITQNPIMGKDLKPNLRNATISPFDRMKEKENLSTKVPGRMKWNPETERLE